MLFELGVLTADVGALVAGDVGIAVATVVASGVGSGLGVTCGLGVDCPEVLVVVDIDVDVSGVGNVVCNRRRVPALPATQHLPVVSQHRSGEPPSRVLVAILDINGSLAMKIS